MTGAQHESESSANKKRSELELREPRIAPYPCHISSRGLVHACTVSSFVASVISQDGLLGLVALGLEVVGGAAGGEVLGEDRLEERAEDDLGAAGPVRSLHENMNCLTWSAGGPSRGRGRT